MSDDIRMAALKKLATDAIAQLVDPCHEAPYCEFDELVSDRLVQRAKDLGLTVPEKRAREVADDPAAALDHLKRQLAIVAEAVSTCVGRDNRHDFFAYLEEHGVTCISR